MIRGSSARRAGISLALGATLACAAAAPAAAQEPELVAEGLANPRGMSFGPGGKLYVAEAGRGGPGPCAEGGEGGQSCYGPTGAIARVNVRSGAVRRILKGLPSHAAQEGEPPAPGAPPPPPGSDATGPHDISFHGSKGYFVIGLGADPAARAQLGSAGRRFAGLYRIRRNGGVRRIADLGAYEQRKNPDGTPAEEGGVDTNPFSLDATGRKRILVTDAGGNDLLSVGRSGRVRTVAVFPGGMAPAPPFLELPPGAEMPYQAVPTGVVRARDGSAYVGQLTGFPFPADAAKVFHVEGGEPEVHAEGFTNIVDIARGRSGELYVLQISATGFLSDTPTTGKLVRVAADGSQTELAAEKLETPTGIAVRRNGDIYVATNGSSPDGAQIVRIAAE